MSRYVYPGSNDEEFSNIAEAYYNGDYPHLDEAINQEQVETLKSEEELIPLGKFKLIEGRIYNVQYNCLGEEKEITARLTDYFAKSYYFERVDNAEEEFVEEPFIKSVKEVEHLDTYDEGDK